MNTYRIKDFGAVADGRTISTKQIQKAIDTCHKEGGGTVICGNGCFRTGTLTLRSNVELHVTAGCRILGSENLKDYEDLEASGFYGENAPEKSVNCLIKAVDAENVAVTGTGEINGCGEAFYERERASSAGKFEKPPTPRPRLVMFYRCRNVLFQETCYVDSACWTFWLMQCENVNVHRVNIRGDRRFRNVDSIDIDACRNVTVSDCIMNTEDDCIILRSIQSMYDAPAVCENVTVNNCVLETACQGVRVGCPADAVIRNAAFTNLVINSTANGIIFQNPKIYLPKEGGALADVHDIVFSNIMIDCKRFPVWLYVEEGIKLKRLSDLSFSNLRIKSGGPCIIQGSTETTIRDICFSNMDFQTTGNDAVVCRNCQDVKFASVSLSNRSAV